MNKMQIQLFGNDDYFAQEAYKVFRSNIQFCGQDVRVIALTSNNENEGKTTVSLNLGKQIADLGLRVLVIDADMRKSVLAGRNTDVKNPKGLSEVLSGMATLEDCVYGTQYENFFLLFAGKYPPNPVELLNSKQYEALIERVRGEYDYVIIDTPPIGLVIDAAVVARICDGVVLVFGENVKFRQARNSIEQLKRSNTKILGVVRNQTGGENRGRYYKGKYKYRYKYEYSARSGGDKK